MRSLSPRARPRPWRRTVALAAAVALAAVGLGGPAGRPASAAPVAPATDPDTPRLTGAQRQVLREATSRFRDVDTAVAAGYQPTDVCYDEMGLHFENPDLESDLTIDPTLPEILLYEERPDGSLRLVAVEFLRADGDGDTSTVDDRPTLFGHPFDGPAVGPGPIPVRSTLHVWLYKHNPDGELTPYNPRVTCR